MKFAGASAGSLGFVHRFLPATDPSIGVTVVVLHGTGGDENDLIGFGQAVAPGASLLSPRGNTTENGAPRFFRRLSEGKFDPAEVRERSAELATFIRASTEEYDLNQSRIFALGYSNGANIASSVMFLDPTIFAGAILLRPMVVIEPENVLRLDGKSVFIGAGRLDNIVPGDHPQRLADMFEARGADVTLCWELNGHNLLPSDIRNAARWFRMHSASAAASFSEPK